MDNAEEKEVKNTTEEEIQPEEVTDTQGEDQIEKEEDLAESQETDTSVSEMDQLKDELSDSKDKYLRLYSEFENYRRRTSKEKLDMVQTANQDLMISLLPVLDDLERAEVSFDVKETDAKTVQEGLELIQSKFRNILEQKGLKAMEGKEGMAFDAELHEAITQIPAPKKKLKGKVVDVIEKGYLLKDKVIRFAKVVIGN